MKRLDSTLPYEGFRKILADAENAKLARLETEKAECRRQLFPIEGRSRPMPYWAMQPMERHERLNTHFSSGFDVTLRGLQQLAAQPK